VTMTATADGAAVGRVAEVRRPTGSDEIAELRRSLGASVAQDMRQQLANALRRRIDVDVDRSTIETVFRGQ